MNTEPESPDHGKGHVWLSGNSVPGTADVLAVGHTLDAICDCHADEPDHEATDPEDRSRRIPHHFDCAAVYAWPAVEAILAARAADREAGLRKRIEAARLEADDLCPHEPDEHAEGTCDICDYAFAVGGLFDDLAAALSAPAGNPTGSDLGGTDD